MKIFKGKSSSFWLVLVLVVVVLVIWLGKDQIKRLAIDYSNTKAGGGYGEPQVSLLGRALGSNDEFRRDVVPIPTGGKIELLWYSSGVDSCHSKGGWAKTAGTYGYGVFKRALTQSRDFKIICNGSNGEVSSALTAVVKNRFGGPTVVEPDSDN